MSGLNIVQGIPTPTSLTLVKDTPVASSPPKFRMMPIIRGWAALVLAVVHHTNVSHVSILRHQGRSSRALAHARRLLAWAFLEVCDIEPEETELAIAWLEQCMSLGRRSIMDGLKDGERPDGLHDVLQTYSRLIQVMSDYDVQEVVMAGVLGGSRPRARVWPKGFLAKLGLE